ncbi:hypothetical protein I6N90_04335 [Paenibacillus sp. GSMTC-2017]|uniref:hypothetical protein n=1 Tax=Paenibacillus sp. GSMTC-2017 TaxID=2794350 RepID=UPI0018D8F8FE|nr:hypothetical protein [Paenibacillus sp. GSMTC-2017]MBH5317035.1 hypothetical protein [Paenibacillus sp. GSMTC-2017]
MIKLLKYDWKRNATVIWSATVILLLVLIGLTTVGSLRDWEVDIVINFSILVFAMSGLLAFLMVCQTFNYNIKAYSRRLLPLPTIYTIVSPIILLILVQLFIFLLFIAHLIIVQLIFVDYDEIILSTLREQNFLELISIVLSVGWATIVATIMIFFSIAISKTIEGRGGTFLGIFVCLLLFILPPYLAMIILPGFATENQSFSFFRLESINSANGAVHYNIVPFESAQLLVLLYDSLILGALLYGIVYMMKKKIKL